MTEETALGAGEQRFRIRLLGSVRVYDAAGNELGELAGSIEQRLLTLLALRAGRACSTADLVRAGWAWDKKGDSGELPPPLSRLRTSWKLTEISKGKRGTTSHILDLPRTAVDALTFIDVARMANPSLASFNEALGLWSDDPRSRHPDTPNWVWDDLTEAVEKAITFTAAVSDGERAQLTNLTRFLDVVRPKNRTPVPTPKRGRLLIVEDNPLMVETLRGLLYDFECVVADSPSAAMAHILDESLELSGAIVDRHLSSSLDSAGLTVLDCLRDTPFRARVPRVLLTSDNPEGPDVEIKRTYGLFAIVTKGGHGAAAPRIRGVIDNMLADPRAQAMARLEGETALLARDLLRASSTVHRAIRQQGATPERQSRLEALQALVDEFQEDQQRLERTLPSLADAQLIEDVDMFLSKWRKSVDDAR